MMMSSYVGCLLDLQAAFPMPESECTGCARPSSPRPNPWRDRVLALEQDVDALRAQAEKDRLGEFHRPFAACVKSITKPLPSRLRLLLLLFCHGMRASISFEPSVCACMYA